MSALSKKIERVTVIFVGQGMTKFHFLQIFKCQYHVEMLRYVYNFLHVIMRLAPLPRVFEAISDLLFDRVNSLQTKVSLD